MRYPQTHFAMDTTHLRLIIAGQIMAGILASEPKKHDMNALAKSSLKAADALIRAAGADVATPSNGEVSRRLYNTDDDVKPKGQPVEIPADIADKLRETETKLLGAPAAEFADKLAAADAWWEARTEGAAWDAYVERMKDVEAKREKWAAHIAKLPQLMKAAHAEGPDAWNALLARVNGTIADWPDWWADQARYAWKEAAKRLIGKASMAAV